ncbi:hypothetical protein N7488_004510 [Penicillium malachiteum]|nr:hypothetical protein N7488_004510 [Penicillium malachiteum]
MRPALTRLLKRPSALSIIDSLAASPIAIEQLDSRYTRLRCQSQCAKQSHLAGDSNSDGVKGHRTRPLWRPKAKKKELSFAVYDIEPTHDDDSKSHVRGNRSTSIKPTKTPTQQLRLDPERLDFESDVGHTDELGSRLVDLPEHRNDFELWEELLRFRQRHYGDQGTQTIWEGMTQRVDALQIPLSGDRADFFWQSFVSFGLKREIFLREIMNYAISIGEVDGECWPRLHEYLVGGLLERGMDKQAIEWHRKLQNSRLAKPGDLSQILPHIMSPPKLAPTPDLLLFSGVQSEIHSRAPRLRLRTLKELCRGVNHDVYGLVIKSILEHGHGEHGLAIHNWLTARQDHPQSMKEIDPLLDYTRDYGLRQEYDNLREYAQTRFASPSGPEIPETIDAELRDEEHSLAKKHQYKDDLAARLFATRALNMDMVIGGLRMIGVSQIGSRTLREMALRVQDGQEILANLKLLRSSGISVADSVFTRLVPKLAAQNREFLLSDLLQSDQHPDVLEDRQVQESLMVSYYMARDWRQYNVSLAILAEHFPDCPDLMDIHFRKHLAAGELSAASKVVDELTLRDRTLSEDSVDFMADKLLPNRRMHHRPQQTQGISERDAMVFLFGVLQRVVPTGCYVSAAFWEEFLKRLGMGNYWDELRDCCLWLAQQYSHGPAESDKHRAIFSSQQRSVKADSRVLTLVLGDKMQQAIVAWGFMFRVTRDTEAKCAIQHPAIHDKLIPWVRGLLLLRELEQAGLTLHAGPIRSATRTRLNLLFGTYSHSAVRFNRMLRRVNPYNLGRVLHDIKLAWGASLFDEEETAQPEQLLNPPRTLRSRKNSAKVILSQRRAR